MYRSCYRGLLLENFIILSRELAENNEKVINFRVYSDLNSRNLI